MDLTYVGYILFVIPGFVVVWTYRHYTKAGQIGEFEYAAWSFLWGVFLFIGVMLIAILQHNTNIKVPVNDPAALLGSILGIGLALATAGAFPLGYLGAYIARKGFFNLIDKFLSKLLEK